MTILLRNWNRVSCEKLYQYADKHWDELYEDHPIEHHNDPTFNKHVDESKFSDVSALARISEDVYDLVGELFDLYNYKDGYEKVSGGVVRWNPGSFMKPHIDNPPGWDDREYAAIVYLNDGFQGGRFQGLGFDHYPDQGDVIIFECNNARHGVTEITSGTRYTYSCWFRKNNC